MDEAKTAGERPKNDQLWNIICSEAELLISPTTFSTFWAHARLVDFAENVMTIEVNNIFAKSQFEQKFSFIIKNILKNHDFANVQLKFVTKSRHSRLAESKITEEVVVIDEPRKAAHHPAAFRTNLNQKYTFQNFVVGTSNDLAYAAARAAAEHPGERYNPIFIYGGVGLGKTHLIQAIGNEIAKNFPEKRVLYATTEEFVNDFVNHIRSKTPEEFVAKYREVDVLIVDDIQFIAGKEKNQTEFFNTFNALHQANKQIIIASDRPPASIPTLTDRLKSRLLMGMAIDVALPDYETRVAIIEAKAASSSVKLPRETAEFLAKNIRSNVRELEGAMNQVLALAELQNIEPTTEFAAGVISNSKAMRPKHLTPRMVIEKTAKYFDLKPADICSAARDADIALPRQIAMYLLRTELHMSFPKISRELGRKDHTTAMHSIDKIERNVKLDITVREKVDRMREVLYE